MKTLKPLANQIVLQEIDGASQTTGGIILPDKAVKKTQQATVISVGPETYRNDDNTPILKPGDLVLVDKYTGLETRIDNVTYLVVQEKFILAKILDTGEQSE